MNLFQHPCETAERFAMEKKKQQRKRICNNMSRKIRVDTNLQTPSVSKIHSRSDFGDLLDLDLLKQTKDVDEMSVCSGVTQDGRGRIRPHVHIQPSPKDPKLSEALENSVLVQFFKLISGLCFNGMNGNYANEMLIEKAKEQERQ